MASEYIDRKTGKRCIEKFYGQRALSLFYGDGWWSRLFFLTVLPVLAHVPWFSYLYGYLQKRPRSARKIASFIQVYGVDKREFLEAEFRSFNDFFIRKLKPEARPVSQDPRVLVAPADARYLVYPRFEAFSIKEKTFSLREFLQNIELTHRYREGSMVIARLCPSDYHRFHFPCDAFVSKAKLIPGPLFSVNPMALQKKLSILVENKRMVTEVHSERFGMLLYLEIGATCVGSIRQTYQPETVVKKGEEKGYFEFGGSCIVLFLEKGKVRFDEDLLRNTQAGFETRMNYGESLAFKVP